MRQARFAVVVLALLLIAGCGTASTASKVKAPVLSTSVASTPCRLIANVNQSLSQLSTVGDNTTVGQIKPAQAKLTTALDAVAKVPLPPSLGGNALNSLKSANDQLAAAIQSQPDDATLAQVGPQLQTFKGQVTQAQTWTTKASATLNCKS